jgi:hypothetical protein
MMGFFAQAIRRRLTKTVQEIGATPEGQAAIETGIRVRAVMEAARSIAGSSLDDSEACEQLRRRLPSGKDASLRAAEELRKLRDNYRDDRAYRLLIAAVDGTAVRPIDSAVRRQFLEEAQLGRMSLNDAFEHLASLEPRLRRFVAQRLDGPPRKQGWSRGSGDSELGLVGRFAQTSNDLLRTDLAWSVVREYVAARTYSDTIADDPTPFFERREHTGGGTFALFEKDTRPRAQN